MHFLFQVDQVVEGLDYAFPESHKIGGVLSTTTRPRARALFAWSAKNDSRPTRVSGGGRKSSSARRPGVKGRNAAPTGKQSTADQEAPLESALSEVISTASSAAKSAPGEKTGNIFGSIFKMLSGGVKSGASDKADKSQPSPRGGFSSVKSIQGSSAGQPSFPSSSSGSSSSMSSVSNGMYLVGAVVLVMHGDVVMDTVTSMVGKQPIDRGSHVLCKKKPTCLMISCVHSGIPCGKQPHLSCRVHGSLQ